MSFLFGGAVGMGSRGDCFYQARELKYSFRDLGHSLFFPRPWEATLCCLRLMTPRLSDSREPSSGKGSILSKEAPIRLRLGVLLSLPRWCRLNHSARDNLTPTSLNY